MRAEMHNAMMNRPLVSIILPTYNQANLLRRSIGSVLKQSYTNWELIVWDDGSTDNTEEIVRSYENQKIKYYHEENRGVYYARNQSVLVSGGEYLAFLDSDDEWMEDKLSAQLKVMIAHPSIDFVFTDFYNINLTTNVKGSAFQQCLSAMKLLDVEQMDYNLFVIKGGLLESLAVENYIATDTVVIRKELLERTGNFHGGLRSSEDFELWWRIGLTGACFAFLKKVYLVRYKYPGSLSSSSILTLENRKNVLDLIAYESLSRGRKDLVPYLKRQYRYVWQNLITAYADQKDGKAMLKAFFMSMSYGFSLGSIRLLFQELFGLRKSPGKLSL